MKNIIIHLLIVIFGFFVFTGCEDLLDAETKSSYTSDVVFSNPAFALNALYGIYSLMTLDEMYSQKIPFYASLNSDIEVVAFGTGDYADNGRRGMGNYLATAGIVNLSVRGMHFTRLLKGPIFLSKKFRKAL